MINSCAKKKKKIAKICQQLGRGLRLKNVHRKREKEVGTLQDISSPEDSNIHGGNYDSEVRKNRHLSVIESDSCSNSKRKCN